MTEQPSNRPDLNVYILGAGFSCSAGTPLMWDFYDVAREIHADPDSHLRDEEKEDFRKVFEFRRLVAQSRDKFSIDLDNIEQLFGLIEMSHRLQDGRPEIRDAMVYLIAKTLQIAAARHRHKSFVALSIHQQYQPSELPWTRSCPRHSSNPDWFFPELYSHFARIISSQYDDSGRAINRENVVITFNYDLVLDDALRQIGVTPNYALAHTSIEEPEFTREPAKRIQFLKLHGSTNWAVCPSCNWIYILRTKAADPFELRSRKCEKCENAPALKLLLVPPSWDKSEYREVMRPVWSEAVAALKAAKRICVIGYSMPETDMFFKFLLTLGLAENQQLLRFIVVDSATQESDLEARYRTMLQYVFAKRRFHFFGAGFAGFLGQGAAEILGRAETMRTTGIY